MSMPPFPASEKMELPDLHAMTSKMRATLNGKAAVYGLSPENYVRFVIVDDIVRRGLQPSRALAAWHSRVAEEMAAIEGAHRLERYSRN